MRWTEGEVGGEMKGEVGYLHGVAMRATQSRLCAAGVPPPPYINSVTWRASAGQHCSSLQVCSRDAPPDWTNSAKSSLLAACWAAASGATIPRAATLLTGVAAETRHRPSDQILRNLTSGLRALPFFSLF